MKSGAGKVSAGILGYRQPSERLIELLLVHPGGPYYIRKDEGVWSIPKGELDAGEEPLEAALRELAEETGFTVPNLASLIALGTIQQKSGKLVHGFAAPLDVDVTALHSEPFEMEWPKGSGMLRSFPEVDRAAYFGPIEARRRINPGQVPLIERLLTLLSVPVPW